jgi:P pilus assembly chaperone PapD
MSGEKRRLQMETTVAALLFVTATVVLSCFAVVYSVAMVQQNFDGSSAQVKMLNDLQQSMLNQTSIINGTMSGLPTEPIAPTPQP